MTVTLLSPVACNGHSKVPIINGWMAKCSRKSTLTWPKTTAETLSTMEDRGAKYTKMTHACIKSALQYPCAPKIHYRVSIHSNTYAILLIKKYLYNTPITDTHIGCFKDERNRDLSIKMHLRYISLVSCARACRRQGFLYMGLQYGEECYCDNKYGRYGRHDASKCFKRCGGECGGGWANSVYSLKTNGR